MLAGKVHDLRHFCFRHLVSEHAAQPHAPSVDVQHDLSRFLPALPEKALKHVNDELHRSVIIVQQNNSIERRLSGLRRRLFNDDAMIRAIGFTVLSH